MRVPPSLSDRVQIQGRTLRFHRDALHPVLRLVNEVGTAVLDGAIRGHTEIRVSPDGILVGWPGRPLHHSGQAVRLLGTPGTPANLFLDGAREPLLYTPVLPPGPSPWTTDDLVWLGKAVATILDLPLWVEWNRSAWDRWNHDPIYRGRVRLQRLREASVGEYPKLYAYRLSAPPGTIDLDRARYWIRAPSIGWIHCDPQQVRTARWRVSWGSIHGVAAVFSRSSVRERPDGLLKISFFDEVYDLLRIPEPTDREAVYLRWLEQWMERRVLRHRSRGTPDDVPAPLRALLD